ncbi:(2Fe-2S)-binding protein [Actinoplanes sp. L3-i22]|uniref:(2Fe-2S)-binding protein n=1 Tax=Actinoplanes sp. L3-i22 TaxID=2836373 RepID=UPI001C84C1A1|nr:(2Fe-2S)-binding protein [Actinoplanes sp. L3-i22]
MGSVEALRVASRLGPYFEWEPWDAEPGWLPLSALLDERMVAARVETARNTLVRMSGLDREAIEERAVASITFLGLASRLLSPLLGAAAAGQALPVPAISRLWWRPVPGGPIPIAYRDLTSIPCAGEPSHVIADRLTETATFGLVQPLLEVFRSRFALSPHVLWGNVASALGGAAGMIADLTPEHAARAAEIVEATLCRPPLRATADLIRPDPGRERWFLVRRNCCLYYRVPGGGTCGDCVLTPPEDRQRYWRSVLNRPT